MGSRVSDAATAVALDRLDAALDSLVEAGVEPVDARDASTLVREVEAMDRRLRSVQINLQDRIDRRGLHRVDGHTSAKVMVRHNAKLSPAEAGRRARAVRALRDLPAVGEAFAAGTIGACQLDRIARAHANTRVRERLCAQDDALADTAARAGSYRVFDSMLTDWVRQVDADGTCDTAERNHAKRDARWVQNYDGSWTFTASCGSLDGAELNEIHSRFTEVEFIADWADARRDHGDATTVDDLDRTHQQRRFDAFAANTRQGASAAAAEPGGSQVVTTIVIDHDTFERLVRHFTEADPKPDGSAEPTFGFGDTPDGHADTDVPSPGDPSSDDKGPGVGFRCSTLDGHPVDPTEAVANALLGHVRRVVVGADSVVIDLGRRRRLFTGPAQLAARLSSTECYWPGCHVPVTDCDTDHLIPWADRGGGSTNPRNEGPACGRHNRHKNHGYSVHRDPAGTWHIHRPDGTELD